MSELVAAPVTTGRSAEDWQTDKTLAERNLYMLKNEIRTDVTFSVSNVSMTQAENSGDEGEMCIFLIFECKLFLISPSVMQC